MLKSKKRVSDIIMYILIYVCSFLSVLLLAGIIIYVFVRGISSVNWSFLTTVTSKLKGTVGIAGNIVNTLYIIIITMLIATPVGVGTAIYLNEYAKTGKLVTIIEYATETSASDLGPKLYRKQENYNYSKIKKELIFINYGRS